MGCSGSKEQPKPLHRISRIPTINITPPAEPAPPFPGVPAAPPQAAPPTTLEGEEPLSQAPTPGEVPESEAPREAAP